MWNAAAVDQKAVNNIHLLVGCGVAYGATSVKARANEIGMMMVSATAVPKTGLAESLRPLGRNSLRHAALDSALTEAAAPEPTTAEATKKAGRSSIMAVTTITAGLFDQVRANT